MSGAHGLAPASLHAEESVSLCEALDRILDAGVVLRGDVVISVAGVDLVYLGLDVLLASVDTAQRIGVLSPRGLPPLQLAGGGTP